MKVLVVSPMYPSVNNRMSGIFVHEQVKKLVENHCEVKVINPIPYVPAFLKVSKKWRAYAELPENTIIDGIEVFYPRYIQIPRGYFLEYSGLLMYWGIRKVIKKLYSSSFTFDLIHSHTAIPAGYCSMMLNKEYKKPHVVTIHGQDFQGTILKNRKCKESVFEVLSEADRTVAISSKLKNIIKNERFAEKVSIIYNGVNLQESGKKKIEKNREEVVVFSASNLIKTKGIDLNLKAIGKLVKKFPQLRYRIAGAGEEREKLMELVQELGLQEKVQFLGRIEHAEVMKEMQNCDIFSLPSYEEGFGVAYIEAMSKEKPIIGVRGQGIQDIVVHDENGILVEPHSIEDIEKAIEDFIENPIKYAAIAAEGKKTVVEKCTWEQNAKNTISLYKELL